MRGSEFRGRKGRTGVWAVFLVFMLALTACGGGGNKGESGQGDGKPAKITFWTFNELHQQFFEHMAELWNKQHPDKPVQLEGSTFPYDDMHNKLLLALQSGVGAPDMADIEISKFANYLKGKPQLVELNDIVEPELANLVKSRLDIYAKDGKYYGIDYHVGASVIYYNKEILDKAGVNPDNIKTWDIYKAAGKTVLEKTGVPMATIEITDQWSFWPLIAQQGGDYLNPDGSIALDSDINIKVLQYLQDLLKEKIAVAAASGFHHSEEHYGMFNKGGAASLWMPMWYMGRFTDYMPDLKGKMLIRPMPSWTADGDRSAGMGGTGTVITSHSKVQAIAKEFLAFAKLSREGNIEIWRFLGFDPIRSDVWDAPEMKESNKFTDYFGDNIFDVLIEIKDEIRGVNIGEMTPAASDAVRSQILVQALNDMKDPATVLKSVADELRKQQ